MNIVMEKKVGAHSPALSVSRGRLLPAHAIVVMTPTHVWYVSRKASGAQTHLAICNRLLNTTLKCVGYVSVIIVKLAYVSST